MSNKTSDNVATEEDINELKSIMNLRTEYGFAYSQKNTLELQKSIRNVLAEREQKDKRIKEIEEENKVWDKKFCKLQDMYFKLSDNSIPKKKVIDVINENGFEVYTKEYGNVEVVSIDVLQELLQGEK